MQQQRGVALLIALLIMATVTVIAVAASNRQQTDIYRTAYDLNQQQALHYVIGAELWAKQILWRDRQASAVDHWQEVWAMQLPPTVVEGGYLSGYLVDLQGRFNINNLMPKEGEVNSVAKERFQRLLAQLDLSEYLLDAIIDWLDADQNVTLHGGAEDNTYLLKNPPYRAANQQLFSVSELRLLHGFTAEMVEKLEPYVTVLPYVTAININTASEEVLMTLSPTLEREKIKQLIVERERRFFPSVTEFLQHSAFAGIELNPDQLTVQSDFFLLHAEAHIDHSQVRRLSLLRRGENGVWVVGRGANM
ncbi:type II secretion system minor pseudopilin GspK [Thioflexithrix psekupsensis]|nr:type II secretion system minor pseudopilin GspK [Thioflexithrix psekupsensis]